MDSERRSELDGRLAKIDYLCDGFHSTANHLTELADKLKTENEEVLYLIGREAEETPGKSQIEAQIEDIIDFFWDYTIQSIDTCDKPYQLDHATKPWELLVSAIRTIFLNHQIESRNTRLQTRTRARLRELNKDQY